MLLLVGKRLLCISRVFGLAITDDTENTGDPSEGKEWDSLLYR